LFAERTDEANGKHDNFLKHAQAVIFRMRYFNNHATNTVTSLSNNFGIT